MTVTVTGDGHDSLKTAPRLFPPFDTTPTLGASFSPEPLPAFGASPFGASPVGAGCRMTTRVEVMVEMIVVVGSPAGAPEEASAAPFWVALDEGAAA